MAQRQAKMPALQGLLTDPLTVRNRLLAGLARMVHEVLERCLATRTMGNNIRGEWTMSWLLILWVTGCLAAVSTAVVGSSTSILTAEGAFEPRIVGWIIRVTQVVLFRASHLLLDSSTVTLGLNRYFTSTTNTRVAYLGTLVLRTW
jgi:acyl-CoA synthetase (AMP-forming)/AMP-acid ligase II